MSTTQPRRQCSKSYRTIHRFLFHSVWGMLKYQYSSPPRSCLATRSGDRELVPRKLVDTSLLDTLPYGGYISTASGFRWVLDRLFIIIFWKRFAGSESRGLPVDNSKCNSK